MDLFTKFDKKAFWEAIKLPLRLFVFAAVGFIVDFLIVYFSGNTTQLGLIVSGLLVALDKYIHEVRSKESDKPLKGLQRGLLPF